MVPLSPDYGERGQAIGQVNLDGDLRGLEAIESATVNDGKRHGQAARHGPGQRSDCGDVRSARHSL